MKILEALKICLNYKVLGGILAVIVLVYIFAPRFAGLAPFLLVLACPLSMVLMMAAMQHNNKSDDAKKPE
jgi:choline-glycine betaine transporter